MYRQSLFRTITVIFFALLSSITTAFAEPIDDPVAFYEATPRSTVVDASGKMHVVFGGDHLYHMWYEGGSWRFETVDAAPHVGEDATLAVDHAGKLHIAYSDPDNFSLKYATNASGTWQVQTAVTAANAYHRNAIAVDASGNSHICGIDNQDRLVYTLHDTAGWHHEIVDANMTDACSIAVDINGTVGIAYHVNISDDLRFAKGSPGHWYSIAPDIGGAVGSYPSLAFDTDAKAHISYYDTTNEHLKYITDKSGAWNASTLDSSAADTGVASSLVVAPGGAVHIVYSDQTGNTVKHVYENGGSWQTETLTNAKNASVSLAVGPAGHLFAAYYNDADSRLYYLSDLPGYWADGLLAISAYPGYYNDIAADAAGHLHVVYYEGEQNALRYATDKSGSWVSTLVDTVDNTNACAITVDNNGTVHLAYLYAVDSTGQAVAYATDAGGSWSTEYFPDTNGSKYSIDIATDSNKTPYISFYNPVSEQLFYLRKNASGWDSPRGFSETGIYAAHAVAFDGLDRLHALYADTNGNLKHMANANRNGGSAHIVTIESGVSVDDNNYPVNFALENNASMQAIYYRYNQGTGKMELKNASYRSGTWTKSVVLPETPEVRLTSHALTLDGDGRPHFAYIDASKKQIIHASDSSNGWDFRSFDDVPAHNILTLSAAAGSDGNLHTAYYDNSTAGLFHAQTALRTTGLNPALLMFLLQ